MVTLEGTGKALEPGQKTFCSLEFWRQNMTTTKIEHHCALLFTKDGFICSKCVTLNEESHINVNLMLSTSIICRCTKFLGKSSSFQHSKFPYHTFSLTDDKNIYHVHQFFCSIDCAQEWIKVLLTPKNALMEWINQTVRATFCGLKAID